MFRKRRQDRQKQTSGGSWVTRTRRRQSGAFELVHLGSQISSGSKATPDSASWKPGSETAFCSKISMGFPVIACVSSPQSPLTRATLRGFLFLPKSQIERTNCLRWGLHTWFLFPFLCASLYSIFSTMSLYNQLIIFYNEDLFCNQKKCYVSKRIGPHVRSN